MPHPSEPQPTPDQSIGGHPASASPADDRRTARRTFALTGPSQTLDASTNAVRPDIADVRLADRVFAPHYAAPLRRTLLTSVDLRQARGRNAAAIIRLPAGAPFDLFDLTGGVAWGIAVETGLVGYVDADVVTA